MNRGLTIARQEENGQTMAEYALVLGFITLVIVTAIGTLSDGVVAALGRVVGLFS